MFRAKASEIHNRIPVSALVVLVTLVLASILSVAAVLQVLQEYALLGEWLAAPQLVRGGDMAALRKEIGTRIIIRSTALAALILCTVATLWLQQRQFSIRRALHEIKLFAAEILASMDQGVITTDLKGTITSLNSAAIQILGIRSECVGRPVGSLPSAGAQLVALANQVAERNEAIWDQEFALHFAGRIRRIRANAHVLRDAAGEALGCLMMIRDVSDRILIEERMRRMERVLSLGTLASGLHHEIKNPLTALSIHVQLLEKRLREPENKKPIDELIDVVKEEITRLNDVLESFHDFASLQRLVVHPADVAEVLKGIAKLIGPQAEQQHVAVAVRCPELGLPRVPLDAEKIKQAVLNLVINGLEAMPDGGRLEMGALANEGELVVEVTDSGPGIPQEIQRDLFKPYFSTKDRGSGMGLALTEKLVGQHGGHIDFRTGPAGTTFSIALPIEPAMTKNGAL